jgi:integrase
MRHTAATIAILNGMPIKAVSEMLGHSSVAITMNIYAHVLPNTHREMAAVMGRILFGAADR